MGAEGHRARLGGLHGGGDTRADPLGWVGVDGRSRAGSGQRVSRAGPQVSGCGLGDVPSPAAAAEGAAGGRELGGMRPAAGEARPLPRGWV